MERFNFTKLRNGRQISYALPDSPLMDEVCRKIFAERDYHMLPFLKPDVILDIGANIGCVSMLMAATYPNAAIFAFEPASEAFSYLRRNTAQFRNIMPLNFGAYDRDTEATLHLGQFASITNSVLPHRFTGEKQERVQLRRISSFLKENGIHHVSIVKMDTEGVEMAILNDLITVLDHIDALMIEYHSEADRMAMDQLLHAHGFTLFASFAEHPHRGSLTFLADHILRQQDKFRNLAIDHERPLAMA